MILKFTSNLNKKEILSHKKQEDVDVGMKLGYGWNAGPFEIADNAGLDTYMLIGKAMKSLGEENLTPRSDLIERLVAEGRLGRKTGKGFY